ncbi:outer membrane protein [Vibrio sp. 10N.261.49.A12]|uniref:outer membrane protein n=1 Tax=Vibrio sp. 10N.261.49.A12 TaxID=3229667 RepID=UPI0035528294
MGYLVTPNWALRGEYRFTDDIGDTTTDKADLHTFLLGVRYRFDLSTPTSALPGA